MKIIVNVEIIIYYSNVFIFILFLEMFLLKIKDINDGEERKVKSLLGNCDIIMVKSSCNGNMIIVLFLIVVKFVGFRLNILK